MEKFIYTGHRPLNNTMNNKYIIFSPLRSGLANVIMSYEIAFAMAYITNRTLILPPSTFLTHITQGGREQWPSIWDLFDKNNNEFDTIELNEYNEFKDLQLGNHYSWFANTEQVIQDYYTPAQIPNNYPLANANFCVVNDFDKNNK